MKGMGNKAGKNNRNRRLSIRAVRRDPLDVRRFGRAVLQLAVEQAAAEADAESARKTAGNKRRGERRA